MSQKPFVQTCIKIGSFLPAIALASFFVLVVFAIPVFMSGGHGIGAWIFSRALVVLFLVWPIAFIANFAMMIHDALHLYNEKPVQESQVVPWVLFLLILAPLSLPIYWYRFLRPKPYDEAAGVSIASIDDLDLPDGTQPPFGNQCDDRHV